MAWSYNLLCNLFFYFFFMQYLNKDDFESTIQATKWLVFVKFSAKNGCKYCTEFAPIYERSSQRWNTCFTYEIESLAVPQDEIHNKYQIRSYPTIIAFLDGVFQGAVPKYKFNSDREIAGILLDEQKKLYNQQCFVEDLMIEINARKVTPIAPVEDFPLSNETSTTQPVEPCEWCQ